MRVSEIDHIGVAVKSIEDAMPYYRDVLGLEFIGTETVGDQKVRVAIFRIGDSRLELLEPTSDDSPISGFLEKRGNGLHHVCVLVDSIESALEQHRRAGSQLIDSVPRIGAHGKKIAFVHPRSTSGVLLELCEADVKTHD
ncbi:MAG: methylmalonyl-CoA epimerase [Candidatus Thorarchaeota archaeon]